MNWSVDPQTSGNDNADILSIVAQLLHGNSKFPLLTQGLPNWAVRAAPARFGLESLNLIVGPWSPQAVRRGSGLSSGIVPFQVSCGVGGYWRHRTGSPVEYYLPSCRSNIPSRTLQSETRRGSHSPISTHWARGIPNAVPRRKSCCEGSRPGITRWRPISKITREWVLCSNAGLLTRSRQVSIWNKAPRKCSPPSWRRRAFGGGEKRVCMPWFQRCSVAFRMHFLSPADPLASTLYAGPDPAVSLPPTSTPDQQLVSLRCSDRVW